MTSPLATGEAFPTVMARDLDGSEVDLGQSVAGHWAVVQFYRGHW